MGMFLAKSRNEKGSFSLRRVASSVSARSASRIASSGNACNSESRPSLRKRMVERVRSFHLKSKDKAYGLRSISYLSCWLSMRGLGLRRLMGSPLSLALLLIKFNFYQSHIPTSILSGTSLSVSSHLSSFSPSINFLYRYFAWFFISLRIYSFIPLT